MMDRRPALLRALLMVSWAVLGLSAALAIGAAAYGNRIQSLPAAPAATGPTVAEEVVSAALLTPNLQLTDADFENSLPLRFGGGEIVNILLVGKDAESDTGARSDAMILCTFNKEADTITMTSFLRDMYVKIPGHKRNRINAAYRFGGVELLKETLYENFGVEVDGSIQVDFQHFEKIIDSLGGVELELTAAEAAFINKNTGDSLSEGAHLLTGKQALLYARNRYDSDGDFSRTNRQRKLLNVLIETYKSKKMTEMLDLIQQLRPLVTTDFSKSDLTGYAFTLFPMLSSARIETQAIPVEGGYSYETIDGKSVLVPDMEKSIQALRGAMK